MLSNRWQQRHQETPHPNHSAFRIFCFCFCFWRRNCCYWSPFWSSFWGVVVVVVFSLWKFFTISIFTFFGSKSDFVIFCCGKCMANVWHCDELQVHSHHSLKLSSISTPRNEPQKMWFNLFYSLIILYLVVTRCICKWSLNFSSLTRPRAQTSTYHYQRSLENVSWSSVLVQHWACES